MAAKSSIHFWQSRQGYGVITLVSLLLVYLIGSRAIDTGSWQQYGLTFVFFIIGLNQLYKLVRR